MSSDAWAVCREVRRRRGWSQRRLAEAVGASPATIARIEKARMEPTLDLLTRIVRAAGYDLTVSVREPSPDESDVRSAVRALSVEDRLRQNDRLSALHASPRRS